MTPHPDAAADIGARKRHLRELLDAARVYTDSVLALVRDPGQVAHTNTGWTVHDVTGHILVWDEETLHALQALAAGGEAYTIAGFASFEDYNRRQRERLLAVSFDHLRDQLFAVRERLKMGLEALPPGAFDREFVFPWPATGTVSMLLLVMAAHERAHAQEIAAAVGHHAAGDSERTG